MAAGFFFGIYAFAFACAQPDKKPVPVIPPEKHDRKEPPLFKKKKEQKTVMPSANWKCSCGRNNPSYVTTCVCGIERTDIVSEDSIVKEFAAEQ